MSPINFAYDGEVGSKQFISHTYMINPYNKTFYPINGVVEDCKYDYHAPLQTVFEKNNIPTNEVTVKHAIKSKEQFVYVLTFKYLKHTILQDLDYNFLLHLPIGIAQAINSGTCVLVLNDAHESAFYTKEFYDQLLLNLKVVSIDKKNIILLTGNPSNNITESPVNLVFWQFFETAVRMATEQLDLPNISYAENSKLKKFLCLNRMPREPRYFFMYEMYKRNLLNHFNVSLDKVNSLDEIISYTDNVFMDSIPDKSQFNKMLSTLPWTVDTTNFNINHWNTNNTTFAYNNLIFIVTETLVQGSTDDLFLTEKTFKPISLQMPFIVIGQSGTLSRLKELGYKTFGDFWDESYDQVLDPLLRMNKICNLVEDLSKLTTEELKSIVINTEDILKHNINLLKSSKPELNIINTILEKL